MADETKKARELQRKFDQILRDLAEQDEVGAEIFGDDHVPLVPTLPRIRLCPPEAPRRTPAAGFFFVRG